ncbi:hypothetical protein FB476_0277 [Ornithinimicrobium humiphilum]|uniref:Uncharacterized protein n=1 Tax=Ornithinimicrobium humiphilum TaxID=125288 RepID=A0A543KK80_9MICO|nr:hypothetical protein [Ornithinimicrobium humiphilum]TQM95434.1 hypothetical protein FB476_0277 [Ornithinimicrobium humiphilum]
MPLFEVKDDGLLKLDQTTLAAEHLWERRHLQAYLRQHLHEIDGARDLLVIAEEFADWTDSKRRIDLLGVDRRGNLVVIELKRGNTGEHMELQAVRYAAMVSTMTLDQAARAFAQFLAAAGEPVDVEAARTRIVEHIDAEDAEEEFGRDVRIVLVSEDFSLEVTSAIMWLSAKGIDITAIRLAVHKLEGRLLLDFLQVIPFKGAEDYQVRVRTKEQAEQELRRNKVPWNGEWYMAYGGRPWGEARTYGFVSAGGRSDSGRLFSQPLFRLPVGGRIWVHAPKTGYLGVAEVLARPVPLTDFQVSVDGVQKCFSQVTQHEWHGPEEGDAIEHFVAVKWLDCVAAGEDPFNEPGLFGNQNIVAQPQDPKWAHTIERLKARFPHWSTA